MMKLISTLAIAGLGAGLAVGAQAQTGPNPTTVNSTTPGIYSLSYDLSPIPTNSGTVTAPVYTYNYVVTLTSDSSGTNVTQVNFNHIQGYINPSAGVLSNSAGMGFVGGFPQETVAPDGTGSAAFTATNGEGYTTVGQTATFFFQSTMPPTGSVSLTSNGTNTNTSIADLGGTGGVQGPGPLAAPAVPEASSLGLLGLGLLPLGLLARRRLANRA